MKSFIDAKKTYSNEQNAAMCRYHDGGAGQIQVVMERRCKYAAG